MAVVYQSAGLTLQRGAQKGSPFVKALQRDLRALGYLRQTIDGDFGFGTETAVRALQYDLLHNSGAPTSNHDGDAPVRLTGYNLPRTAGGGLSVTGLTGIVDQDFAACIAAMLADTKFVKLPFSANPAADNAKALAQIRGQTSTIAPTAFIAAMIEQESNGQHYRVPPANGPDTDNFVVTGMDRNNKSSPDQITSRGFGIGQYTLFHHPPQPGELAEFIADPLGNVKMAYRELRSKFDNFVAGPTDTADDRLAEHPLKDFKLRVCKYQPGNPLYLNDCKACAAAAAKLTIREGAPVFAGSPLTYQPTQYYTSAYYSNVPSRAEFPCDWPYAARRYNGSGINSFHYQTRILRNLLTGTNAN